MGVTTGSTASDIIATVVIAIAIATVVVVVVVVVAVTIGWRCGTPIDTLSSIELKLYVLIPKTVQYLFQRHICRTVHFSHTRGEIQNQLACHGGSNVNGGRKLLCKEREIVNPVHIHTFDLVQPTTV